MFKDYYAILEIAESASQEEIKSAYKKQAISWHPDKNPGVDTTQRMQEINEAYLILKDSEARGRYNSEYQRFKQYQKQKAHTREEQKKKNQDQEPQKENHQKEKKKYENYYNYSEFNIKDDILKKWMENAKRQAVELAKQTLEDVGGMVVAGTKAAAIEAGSYFLFYSLISVIILLIVFVIKFIRN